MNKISKSIFLTVLTFISTTLAAQEAAKYKIGSVVFNVKKGRTQPSAIERNITDINYSKVFDTEDELKSYFNDIQQELVNLRLFDSVKYTYVLNKKEQSDNPDSIFYADAVYTLKDSFSIIVFPKPSLNSNSGFEAKLKLKDTNFMGLMEPLDVDVNLQFGDSDDPDDYSKVYTGFNFSYDYPFQIGKTQETWKNDFNFTWQIGEESPEFEYNTGLTFAVPFGRFHNKLVIDFTQSIVKDLAYKDYGDDLYFIEQAAVSTPLVLGYIGNTTPVMYTPKLSFTNNWDIDGINELNTDLNKTPVVELSQTFTLSRINWKGPNNFRDGYMITSTQSVGWNYNGEITSEKVLPVVKGEVQLYKAFKYVGFAIDMHFIGGLNSTTKVGSYIRGAADNQKYSSKAINKYHNGVDVDMNNYALETPAALVFNFDMPVHIVTTHWLDWSYALFGAYDTKPSGVKAIAAVPHFLMKYLDFEMQWSPFMDVGLLKNRCTDATLSLDEAIVTGGLEVLIYPSRWKSFVIRASAGVDLSKKILDGRRNFDSSWRKGGSLEYFIGLGRHF